MTRAGQRYSSQLRPNDSFAMGGRIKLKNSEPTNDDKGFQKMLDKYKKEPPAEKKSHRRNETNHSTTTARRDDSTDHYTANKKRKRSDFQNSSQHNNSFQPRNRRERRRLMHKSRSKMHLSENVLDKETEAAVEMKSGSKFVFCLADEVESVSSDSEDEEQSVQSDVDSEEGDSSDSDSNTAQVETGDIFPFIEYLERYKPNLAPHIEDLHPSWYDTLYKEMKEKYLINKDRKKRKQEEIQRKKQEMYAQIKRDKRRRKKEKMKRKKQEKARLAEKKASNQEQALPSEAAPAQENDSTQ